MILELLVPLGLQVLPALQAILAQREQLVLLEQLVQVTLVQPDLLELLVIPDLLELQELLEQQAVAVTLKFT